MKRYRKKNKKAPRKNNNLSITINDHFENIVFDWNYQTYLFIGGYGSSKSHNGYTKVILKCLEEAGRVVLAVRKYKSSMRNSSYSLCKKIIKQMNAEHLVRFIDSRLEAEFINGSRIIFTGIDDPEKIKSVDDISIVICEEASELSYNVYTELLGRIRHMTFTNHFILMSNPTSLSNWLYKHFFKNTYIDEISGRNIDKIILDDKELYVKREMFKNNTYYHHSVVDDNYFVPEDYINRLNEMKEYDPDRYRVGRLGQFGLSGIKVLPQFTTASEDEIKAQIKGCKMSYFVGGDWGFVESYNAFVKVAVDLNKQYLYILDEYYSRNKQNEDIELGINKFKNFRIVADCAEPKTIEWFRLRGFNMQPCHKFPGSVLANIKKIKGFKKIICSTKCINTINELQELTYKKDRNNEIIEDTFEIDSHVFDAIAYALDSYNLTDIKELSKRDLGL